VIAAGASQNSDLAEAFFQMVEVLVDVFAIIDICDNHQQHLVADLVDDAAVARTGN
jgi:hypothetical protein